MPTPADLKLTNTSDNTVSDITKHPAVALLAGQLGCLPHPDGSVKKLVMFTNTDDPGVQKITKQIAEAILHLLDTEGYVK